MEGLIIGVVAGFVIIALMKGLHAVAEGIRAREAASGVTHTRCVRCDKRCDVTGTGAWTCPTCSVVNVL